MRESIKFIETLYGVWFPRTDVAVSVSQIADMVLSYPKNLRTECGGSREQVRNTTRGC